MFKSVRHCPAVLTVQVCSGLFYWWSSVGALHPSQSAWANDLNFARFCLFCKRSVFNRSKVTFSALPYFKPSFSAGQNTYLWNSYTVIIKVAAAGGAFGLCVIYLIFEGENCFYSSVLSKSKSALPYLRLVVSSKLSKYFSVVRKSWCLKLSLINSVGAPDRFSIVANEWRAV